MDWVLLFLLFLKAPPVVAVVSLGLVGSYNLFNIEDIKNIEGTSAEDIELYKKMYYKQFKKQKLKNIMISTGATALIAGAVIFSIFSNFGFGSDYDVCFDPRC